MAAWYLFSIKRRSLYIQHHKKSKNVRRTEEITPRCRRKTSAVSESATSNPRCGAMQHMQPVASLRISNQFYVLTERINCLEKLLGTSVSKHLDIVNPLIQAGGVKIINTATTVEERFKRESYR